MHIRRLLVPLSVALTCAPPALASDLVVAASGGQFTTIQAALDVAGPGDRVLVRERPGGTPWREKVVFQRGGDAALGFLELRSFPGEAPIIDGAGVPGPWMITIDSLSWVRVEGLTLVGNDDPQGDGSGVRVVGAGERIEILGNTFRDFVGQSSMAITVYGTSTTGAIQDLRIVGNTVLRCEPAPSEAIVVNGNVRWFEITDNHIEDVNNIGIDVIGGDASINPLFGARDGLVAGNRVVRARESSGAGYAAGIYADGAERVVIEGNTVVQCDQGIEVGLETAGWTSTDVVVRNNVVVACERVGIAVGGFAVGLGAVQRARIVNNLLFWNATGPFGTTEMWLNIADSTMISGNVIVLGRATYGLFNTLPATNTMLNNNLWWKANGGVEFEWLGQVYSGLNAFRSATGFEARGRFADPLHSAPFGADGLLGTLDDDFRLTALSPCIDAGDTAALGLEALLDADGLARFVDASRVVDSGLGLAPRPDLGPYERQGQLGDIARLCPAVANSTGAAARMQLVGSSSLTANDLVLSVSGAPAVSAGFFVLAAASAESPIGSGILCVSGPVVRMPAQFTDAQGRAVRALDWGAPTFSLPTPLSGSLRVLTFAHRDSVGGMSTFNFADALGVTLAP